MGRFAGYSHKKGVRLIWVKGIAVPKIAFWGRYIVGLMLAMTFNVEHKACIYDNFTCMSLALKMQVLDTTQIYSAALEYISSRLHLKSAL